ncbi:hypothetical protein JW865_02365 [Candidatus Bathyarchaeota archaeon]|nr:hypothetical protein [Candidatus Bathyarchaeota archaeon]
MKIQLIATTPNIETLVATAVLTTTSGAQPSILFDRMREKPDKVNEIIEKIEVQHGSILEHNRIIWSVEAEEFEILDILLKTKFFTFTRIGSNYWIISGNLRTIIEYWNEQKDDFSKKLLNSLKDIVPSIYSNIKEESN